MRDNERQQSQYDKLWQPYTENLALRKSWDIKHKYVGNVIKVGGSRFKA